MRQFTSPGRSLALACMIALCGAVPAQAQDDRTVGKAVAQKQAREIDGAGPARWQHPDGNRQAALKTLQKEIGAAYDEAKRACAKGPAGERSACLRTARRTWQDDMKNAPAQLDAAGGMGSVTTTTTTATPAGTTTSSTTTGAGVGTNKDKDTGVGTGAAGQ
jgi:hypothetical protein